MYFQNMGLNHFSKQNVGLTICEKTHSSGFVNNQVVEVFCVIDTKSGAVQFS